MEFIEILEKYERQENSNRVPKSLVKVEFEEQRSFVYLCDIENVVEGDVVTVEGRLEEQTGIVTKVLTSFKTPHYDMKWVESVVDRDISGTYYKMNNDVVSFDSLLNVEKFVSLYIQSKYKENKAYGDENVEIDLSDLKNSEVFDREIIKERGMEIFKNEGVQFISLNNGVGKAIVRGNCWYEIDFKYNKGKITYLVCECPYVEPCKHTYALLLKLKEILPKVNKKGIGENFVMCQKDCFNYIMRYAKGTVSVGL